MSSGCRGCGSDSLETFLSLGELPLANSLREPGDTSTEKRYPLELALCEQCCLVQITYSVPPEEMFTEYLYFSSFSETMVANARDLVERLIEEKKLDPGSLAMEIASNDGYLLQHYVARGVPVLGVDPARNLVEAAQARGVDTVCEFFSSDLAERFVAEGKTADIVHANNVLAHVPQINDVVAAMRRILRPEGVVVIETPYLRDMIEKLEFDTTYHEHLFYYSFSSLKEILERNGLTPTSVERLNVHGGSLRVFAADTVIAHPDASVAKLLAEEGVARICESRYFKDFSSRVMDLKDALRRELEALKDSGHRVAAYGAAAKGAILLNAFDIGKDILDFVADKNVHKQGRTMPGVGIPVVAPEMLLEEMPDVTLMLVWNLTDEIVAQESEYLDRGGRFLVPVPEPRMISR